MVQRLGGQAVHINFWAGLGVYKSIRDLDLPIFLHFQKSGDKVLTNKNHDFHIDWNVICKLATMMGSDFIHAGMWGGYLSEEEKTLQTTLKILQAGGTMPALSCGMHPGLVSAITSRFGNDILLNCGGAIHGHPLGTKAGVMAMYQAVNGQTDAKEYKLAIEKWGLVK
jgi:2,3-diketo-5-methylthiopentyl-1-phosphate enolase